jgi:AmiR/NasT family two-component response regulator
MRVRRDDDIKVIAQVAVGTDIVPAALAERPDLAVLDIDLPGADGLTAAFIALGLLTAPWLLRRYGTLAQSLLAPIRTA